MAPTLGAVTWSRDAETLRRRAVELENLGFASVGVGDHLIPQASGPLLACAIIAQATTRVRVGPFVLNNDLRHPVVLAREAAALADLSQGRFELGLGSGYARAEYERAGIEFLPADVRAARLAESARILRGLLAGETVDFAGEHYVVRGETLAPPTHPVPILIGGNSQAVHAAAAEHADILGLIGFSPARTDGAGTDFSTAGLERQVARLRELAGTRFAEIELHTLVQWHDVTGDREAAAERAAAALELPLEIVLDSPYVLLGTADEIAARLHDHSERFGVTRSVIFADRPDLAPAESLEPVLERLA
jgi:probable F420-dependent oxidoreductase